MDDATTAQSNTAVGYAAGGAITTGDGSVYIGTFCGGQGTTAHTNTFIGANAGYDVTTGNNLVLIGHAAGYNAGNDIVDGTFGIYLGAFSMASAGNVSNEVVIGYNSQGKGGNTAYFGQSSIYNAANSTTFSQTSDIRIKKNIIDNNSGLDILNQIQVKNFDYKTREEIENDSPELKDVIGSAVVEKEGTQLGVIAQEIEKFLPEVVKTEDTGVKTIDPDNLTWYMINAIKELSAEVEKLKNGS